MIINFGILYHFYPPMTIRAVIKDINSIIYPFRPQKLGIPKPSMAIGTPIEVIVYN